METLRKYILSVVAAAILHAVVQSLVDKHGTSAALLRLIGGLFLTFTIIAPIADVDFHTLFDIHLAYTSQGTAIAAHGKQIAQDELVKLIKEDCEAYILDKAMSLCTPLQVEVCVAQGNPPVPSSVQLNGSISPYVKNTLKHWIEDELGIPQENQLWTE